MTAPNLILRMGSHAEKDYILRMARFTDGLIIGANLMEATPGATASLLVDLAGAKGKGRPYFLDPMTYAYGLYVDAQTGKLRDDLDWIKSDQTRKGKTTRTYKRSYRALADQFGPPFVTALQRNKAVTWLDLGAPADLDTASRAVVAYQLERVKQEFEADPEFKSYADDVPRPAAVFAPYFYLDPVNLDNWLALGFAAARATVALGPPVPVHMVLCVDGSALRNGQLLDRIKREVPGTGVAAVWLWLSKLHEDAANVGELRALRDLVQTLSQSVEVYNMHGGFFSLALSKYGLSGVSHGVGYGEQKDVVPVIGQSTPTVRYYLPPFYKRLGVPDIERCFDALGVKTPGDFYSTVCDCVVCKGVVSTDLREFQAFGELHRSTPTSKRDAQTPAAAKRCRFHFLVSRVRERDWVRGATVADILARIDASAGRWSGRTPMPAANYDHLARWRQALS